MSLKAPALQKACYFSLDRLAITSSTLWPPFRGNKTGMVQLPFIGANAGNENVI